MAISEPDHSRSDETPASDEGYSLEDYQNGTVQHDLDQLTGTPEALKGTSSDITREKPRKDWEGVNSLEIGNFPVPPQSDRGKIADLVDYILESHGHQGCGVDCPAINEAWDAIEKLLEEITKP